MITHDYRIEKVFSIIFAGDNLEFTLEGDKGVMKPVTVIDWAQAWFWSDERQKKLNGYLLIKSLRESKEQPLPDVMS